MTNLSDLGRFWTGAQLGSQDPTNPIPFVSLTDPSYPACVLSKLAETADGTGNHAFGEFEREAVIRNAAQFYTARQQIYTIVVRADAMSTEYGGGPKLGSNPLNKSTVLGSAQALFQVWRDPDPSSGHPCFVRLCKILSL